MNFLLFGMMSLLMTPSCNLISIKESALESVSALNTEQVVISDINQKWYTYDVKDFTSIDCSLASDIEYTVSATPTCRINMPEKLYNYLKVYVEDGVLYIRPNANLKYKDVDIDIIISSSNLRKVDLSGAADFELKSALSTDRLELQLSGAVDFEADNVKANSVKITASGACKVDFDNLECKNIDADICGAGKMELAGKAETGSVSISGAGSIDLRKFYCPGIQTEVSGVGSVKR